MIEDARTTRCDRPAARRPVSPRRAAAGRRAIRALHRPILAFALAVLGWAALPIGPARADLPHPFDGPAGGNCRACAALVLSVGAEAQAGADAAAGALAARGYTIERLEDPGILALERGIDAFFAAARASGARRLAIWYGGPLAEREGRAALAARDTAPPSARAPSDRLDAIRLPGLADQITASGVAEAVLILEPDPAGAGERPALDLDLQPADAPQILTVIAPRPVAGLVTGLIGAPAIAFAQADADGDGALRASEIAALLGPGAEARLLNAPPPERARPAAPAPDGPDASTGIGALLDLGRLAAEQRSEAWRGIARSNDLAAIRRFLSAHCVEAEGAECASAREAIRRIESLMSQQVLECHRLATHPNDPATDEPGVPAEAMESRRAQAACFAALQQRPDDARLRYQYGRALDLLSNTRFAVEYERAAADGYAMAAFSLARAILEGRVGPVDEAAFARAMRLLETAGSKGMVDAQLLRALLLLESPRAADRETARGLLESIEDQSPLAQLQLARLRFAETSERDEEGLRRIEVMISDALRRGLLESDETEARALLNSVRERIEAIRQARLKASRPADPMIACRAALDFDPLALFGFFDLTDVMGAGTFSERLGKIQRTRLRPLNLGRIVEACDKPMAEGKGAPALMARYGYLLWQLETAKFRGRSDYGQTRGLWRDLFEKAAEGRDRSGMFFYGLLLRSQKESRAPGSFKRGQNWLQRAHRAGVAEATFYLALPHIMRDAPSGSGFRALPERGYTLLSTIADRPIPIVKVLLANVLANPQKYGIAPKPDAVRLIQRYLKEARELGVEWGN
ncbi:MAG: hypothetical protein AAF074_04765 [Pseudomonadota bacterium]